MVEPIKYYDSFASDYDIQSSKYEYYSPEVLFGLVSEYLKKNQNLLDIGIGTGKSAIPFKKVGLKIFGVDGSKEMIKVCKSKQFTEDLNIIDLKNDNLPYENNKFDIVISNGVFYFFRNLEIFFKESYRVLKPKEIFAFTIDYLKNNKSNNLISKRTIKKNGINIYQHKEEYIMKLAKNYKFNLLKKLEYLAYNSPSENKDIYFKAYVFIK